MEYAYLSAGDKYGVDRKGPRDSEFSRRSRGRPKAGEVAAIKRDLFTAAAEQFLTNGFVGTSMAEIVAAAGMSKTTLYARYASKEDLFRALMAQLSESRFPDVTTVIDRERETPLVEALQKLAEMGLNEALTPEWTLFDRLIISEGARFPELVRDSMRWRGDVAATMTGFIKHCANRDGIPCNDPEGVARMFLAALRGFLAEAITSGRAVPMKERRQFAADTARLLMADRANW